MPQGGTCDAVVLRVMRHSERNSRAVEAFGTGASATTHRHPNSDGARRRRKVVTMQPHNTVPLAGALSVLSTRYAVSRASSECDRVRFCEAAGRSPHASTGIREA